MIGPNNVWAHCRHAFFNLSLSISGAHISRLIGRRADAVENNNPSEMCAGTFGRMHIVFGSTQKLGHPDGAHPTNEPGPPHVIRAVCLHTQSFDPFAKHKQTHKHSHMCTQHGHGLLTGVWKMCPENQCVAHSAVGYVFVDVCVCMCVQTTTRSGGDNAEERRTSLTTASPPRTTAATITHVAACAGHSVAFLYITLHYLPWG